jgi:hypothetical protein
MTYFLLGMIGGAIAWEAIKWAWKKYITKQ